MPNIPIPGLASGYPGAPTPLYPARLDRESGYDKDPFAFFAEKFHVSNTGWVTTGFEAGTPADVVAQYVWNGPIFDLRADLAHNYGLATQGALVVGQKGSYGGITELTLLCRIPGMLISAYTQDLRVYSADKVNPVETAEMVRIYPWSDITTSWWAGDEAVLLKWTIPGQPIRYWSPQLRFDQASGTPGTQAPDLVLFGNVQ